MKKLIVVLVALGASVASAGKAECTRDCATTIKECQNTCKRALEKKNPSAIGLCQSKCKEFEKECTKECQDESQGKKPNRKH